MKYGKFIKREARIITEIFDHKFADGVTRDSGLKDDDWGGLRHQCNEQTASLSLEQRSKIIALIAETYVLDLTVGSREIDIEDKTIRFLEYYSTKFAGTQSLRDLSDMDSNFFRTKIGEILAAIPKGLQQFRGIAEESPFLFQ